MSGDDQWGFLMTNSDSTPKDSSTFEMRQEGGNLSLQKESIPDLCPLNRENNVVGLDSKQSDDSLNETNEDKEPDHVTLSFWQTLTVVYIPFLYQLLCDTLSTIQSIPVTYAFQTFFQSDEWTIAKLYRSIMPPWLETGTSVISLPPRSLVFLALLTITALVVHPDGLTWILYRRLR